METNNANAAESDKILELFRDVDDKLEGSGEEQEDALRILREHEDEVSKPAPCVISITKSLISYRFKSWKIDTHQVISSEV